MSTTYHGVHARRRRGMTREEREWWALPCGVESGMDVTLVVARADIRSEMNLPPLKLLRGSGLRRVYVASSGSMDKVGGEVGVDSRRLLLEIIISCRAISVIQ